MNLITSDEVDDDGYANESLSLSLYIYIYIFISSSLMFFCFLFFLFRCLSPCYGFTW